MKYLLTTFLFAIIYINSYSQINVIVDTTQEIIYPLQLNKPNINDNLLPLKKLFESKTIIGMGEATHGTKEFFETKVKTFQFLVTHCNYRVFGIEASYGECNYINDYVETGIGNIDSVMSNFSFWTWRTQEVKELILYIKNYNQSKTDSEKILFCGFDMQDFYSPLKYISDFFKLDYSTYRMELDSITHPILSKTKIQLNQKWQDKKLKFDDTLNLTYTSLKSWIEKNKATIKHKYQKKQIEKLNLCVNNYHQSINMKKVSNISKYRDSCMAYNIVEIQKIENAKMFIWAHNGHINLSYPENYSISMGLPMGGYIKNIIDSNYYAIGFIFNQGSFQAIKGPNTIIGGVFMSIFSKKHLYKGLIECTVPINKTNTFTNALSTAFQQPFFIDLASTNNRVFTTRLWTYDIGSVYFNYKNSSWKINAKKQFNGLIYIPKITRAIPIKLK